MLLHLILNPIWNTAFIMFLKYKTPEVCMVSVSGTCKQTQLQLTVEKETGLSCLLPFGCAFGQYLLFIELTLAVAICAATEPLKKGSE